MNTRFANSIGISEDREAQLRDPRKRVDEQTSAEWRRIVIYLASGALLLIAMLSLSKGMTPKDEELLNQDLAGILAAWDGVWEGSLHVYDETGRLRESYTIRQQVFSQSSNYQVTVQHRIDSEGDLSIVETGNKIEGGRLRSIVIADNGHEMVMSGRWQDGQLFWYRNDGDVTETIREWIEGNVYHVEGFGFSLSTRQGYMFTGRYHKVFDAESRPDKLNETLTFEGE